MLYSIVLATEYTNLLTKTALFNIVLFNIRRRCLYPSFRCSAVFDTRRMRNINRNNLGIYKSENTFLFNSEIRALGLEMGKEHV